MAATREKGKGTFGDAGALPMYSVPELLKLVFINVGEAEEELEKGTPASWKS